MNREMQRKRERLVCRITRELMTNGSAETAVRLQLRGRDEKDLGGYSRKAVRFIIRKNLAAHEVAAARKVRER